MATSPKPEAVTVDVPAGVAVHVADLDSHLEVADFSASDRARLQEEFNANFPVLGAILAGARASA